MFGLKKCEYLQHIFSSSSNQMAKMDTLVKTGPDGLLDVTVSSLGLRKDITPDVVMGCEVTIADTEFYIREELELFQYPSKLSNQCSLHCVITLFQD